jgi:hypothetical protein
VQEKEKRTDRDEQRLVHIIVKYTILFEIRLRKLKYDKTIHIIYYGITPGLTVRKIQANKLVVTQNENPRWHTCRGSINDTGICYAVVKCL